MSNASVSVVIPAFNSARHISAAILSAKNLGVHEVIVVNDGSTDKTAEIAHDLGCTVISQENSGAAKSRRTGLKAVSTPLTIMLDADDTLVAEGVEESIRLATIQQDSPLVAGPTLSVTNKSTREMGLWPEGISVESLLTRGFSPGPPAAFLWRTAALRIAMSDSPPALNPRYAEDYELLIRTAMQGKVVCHDKVACVYASEGGKSAVAPLRSNTAAEDIRRYYAKVCGVSIRQRKDNELQSMAYLRLAYSSTGLPLRKVLLISRAAVTTPALFPELLVRKIHRVLRKTHQ